MHINIGKGGAAAPHITTIWIIVTYIIFFCRRLGSHKNERTTNRIRRIDSMSPFIINVKFGGGDQGKKKKKKNSSTNLKMTASQPWHQCIDKQS